MTRLQSERLTESRGTRGYPPVDASLLDDPRYHDACILHPLPRVDELDYALDDDDRAVYFKQAAYGVPVRMALLAALLGLDETVLSETGPAETHKVEKRPTEPCSNPRCVTGAGSEQPHIVPTYRCDTDGSACVYCGHEIPTSHPSMTVEPTAARRESSS